LYPLSCVGFVAILVASGRVRFPRSLAVLGLVLSVLGASVSGARALQHRALAQEIALVAGRGTTPTPAPAPQEAQNVTIDGAEIVAPVKIRDVAPVYPAEAVRASVEGTVVVEAIIDIEGNVQKVKVLESIPLLDEAALDAVRQWKYTPATRNGELTPIVMKVSVNFELD